MPTDVLTPSFDHSYNAPPGGMMLPYNPQPPDNTPGGNGGFYAIPQNFIPGQIPQDTGGGGDTQVGYPSTATPPAVVYPTYQFESGTPLVVDYLEDGASVESIAEGIPRPPIHVYFGTNSSGPGIPGSVRFTFRGRTYVDRGGSLYYNISSTTNAGTLGGFYDYNTNMATISDYASSGGDTITVISLGTRYAESGVSGVMFFTVGSFREGSFTVRATTSDGTELIGTADIDGVITGDQMKGKINARLGVVQLAFGEMVTAAGNEAEEWYDSDLIDGSGNIWKPTYVDPATIFYGGVFYKIIPVDPNLVGIDPVRLPSDGRVLAFNPGTPVVISHTQTTSVPSPVADHVHTLRADGRISFIEVRDSLGAPIDDSLYDYDLDAGTLTWAHTLNFSAYTLPAVITDRIQDLALLTDVQIDGTLSLASAITHDFPSGTIVSNALAFGDMQSRVTNIFDQETYNEGTWSDSLAGSAAGSTYDSITYPITTTNEGAVADRWAIVFTSSLNVKVISELRGEILVSPITNDIAPVNPVTGAPYFFIDKDGWGTGWSAGNVVRFNTESAQEPFWAARVTMPGEITVEDDRVRINAYGNAD